MFQIGQYIVYHSAEVCQVEAIGPLRFAGDRDVDYYTLRPFDVDSSGKIYIPVDTAVFMRAVITKAEALRRLKELELLNGKIPGAMSRPQLANYYRELLLSHDLSEQLKLFKELHCKSRAAPRSKKGLALTEQRLYKQVGKLLSGELSLALRETPERSMKRLRAAAEAVQK